MTEPSATYFPGGVEDNALEFALYGIARQRVWPKWHQMNAKLPILELGPGTKWTQGAIPLEWPDFDFEAPNCLRPKATGVYRAELPYPSDSVGGVIATHVLEHLMDPRPIIGEIARVLAPGCPFNILVPHADSNVFKHDLDHKSCYILDTWNNLLKDGFYDHTYGRNDTPRLRVGCNFKFGIKEGNEMVVTQLVKE